MERRIIFYWGKTIVPVLLLSLSMMGCGGGDTPSEKTGASPKGAVSPGDNASGAGDQNSGGQSGSSGQLSMDLSGLQKEYARLTGSSFATTSNVIYYPSLKEYSNCGDDQLHALLAGQTITPETANPCGAPPTHFYEKMRVPEDSADFLHSGQKAEIVGGHTVFHFENGQQVVVKPNSEKQKSIINYHAMKIQAPK
jgi:hypothetical protein